MSSTVRRPAVAGYFYPQDPEILRTDIARLLGAVECEPGRRIRALIAPHAGYEYSGPTAAHAYAAVGEKPTFRRVVLLGPAHRAPVPGLALPTVGAFETPLGCIALDLETMGKLLRLPQVIASDLPHLGEHSLEVHLPFLQMVLDDFRLVPLVVGDADGREVEQVLEQCIDDYTLLVVSTDLSHFLSYDDACRNDRNTIAGILDYHDSLRGEQACGCRAVNGLARLARSRGWAMELVDYRNSGDTAGSRDRVVGYAALAASDG